MTGKSVKSIEMYRHLALAMIVAINPIIPLKMNIRETTKDKKSTKSKEKRSINYE